MVDQVEGDALATAKRRVLLNEKNPRQDEAMLVDP
jgi:hypothetical protein